MDSSAAIISMEATNHDDGAVFTVNCLYAGFNLTKENGIRADGDTYTLCEKDASFALLVLCFILFYRIDAVGVPNLNYV